MHLLTLSFFCSTFCVTVLACSVCVSASSFDCLHFCLSSVYRELTTSGLISLRCWLNLIEVYALLSTWYWRDPACNLIFSTETIQSSTVQVQCHCWHQNLHSPCQYIVSSILHLTDSRRLVKATLWGHRIPPKWSWFSFNSLPYTGRCGSYSVISVIFKDWFSSLCFI